MSMQWSVPPLQEPVRRRRRPLVAVGVVVGLAVIGASAVGMWIYVNHDRTDLLDLLAVDDTAESACAELTAALHAASQANSDRAQEIAAGNAAIEHLVDTMEALGGDTLAHDRPALDWIADWKALVAARQDLQGQINAGTLHPRLVVPLTDDGYPITTRMTVAAPTDCETAIGLSASP